MFLRAGVTRRLMRQDSHTTSSQLTLCMMPPPPRPARTLMPCQFCSLDMNSPGCFFSRSALALSLFSLTPQALARCRRAPTGPGDCMLFSLFSLPRWGARVAVPTERGVWRVCARWRYCLAARLLFCLSCALVNAASRGNCVCVHVGRRHICWAVALCKTHVSVRGG